MTKRFALGIDLGTSNSALAYRALDGDETPRVLPVPQLLSFHSLGERETLPSAIYTFTPLPGGDLGALRLTLVSIAIAMLALVASEVLARRISRRMDVA